MKRFLVLLFGVFGLAVFLSPVFAMKEFEGNTGTVVTFTPSESDFWGKHDNNITAPSFSKASIDKTTGIIKARAYSSLGIPFVSPNRQIASGHFGSYFRIKSGNAAKPSVKLRVTFKGSYKGEIGALGVAAGRVLLEGSFGWIGWANPIKFTILDTESGGIPSGTISSSFEKSFYFKAWCVGDPVAPTNPYYIRFDAIVAAGTSTMKTVGVCDNDFYEGDRQIKLDWIKIEVLDPNYPWEPEKPVPGGGAGKYR